MSPTRDALISLGSSLSPSMRVLGRLGERLRDPGTTIEEIVLLVRIDPSLTFKILRLANGVMFGARNRCDALEDAVARVGVGEVHRIVGLAASHQAFQGDLANYGFPAGLVWENSSAVAALASTLAKRCGADPRACYTAGLLRNVGRAVLDRVPTRSRYRSGPLALDGWERETYGCTAASVSALLLNHWRFPDALVAMVEHHEDPLAAAGAHAPLASLLHLACRLADELGAGLPGEEAPRRGMTEVAGVLGLDDVTIVLCRDEAQAEIERTRAALDDLRAAA